MSSLLSEWTDNSSVLAEMHLIISKPYRAQVFIICNESFLVFMRLVLAGVLHVHNRPWQGVRVSVECTIPNVI